MEILLSYSGILEEITTRLKFISGKRAVNADEYYRYAACEADTEMLSALTEEAVGWLSMKLGGHWGGTEHGADSLKITLNIIAPGVEAGRVAATVTGLMRETVIHVVIYRWCVLTRMPGAVDWLQGAEEILGNLFPVIQKQAGLPLRPLPPI